MPTGTAIVFVEASTGNYGIGAFSYLVRRSGSDPSKCLISDRTEVIDGPPGSLDMRFWGDYWCSKGLDHAPRESLLRSRPDLAHHASLPREGIHQA